MQGIHTNALAGEKSPYLRQHASNPVDWLPWGEAAFAKARTEQKPIFLSIGYSTCHWCHVMAHESFENTEVASVLNRSFVPIKVDREERPDVDRIYMLFVQASTGSGGWPMSVFLTPDLKPFFGGTYFPPDSRYGRPGFKDLLEHLERAWMQDRSRIEQSGREVTGQLSAMAAGPASGAPLEASIYDVPFWQFRRAFDSTWGGFGSAPKFPRPVIFNYLLRYSHTKNSEEALEMAVQTLWQMAAGGMHDQLGGGFHRYSVDERWFVPHFEKMLYDQAQLAVSYLEAFQVTGDERFSTVARGIFTYVLRDLRDGSHGFYSAEDADSPDPANPAHSGEGAFYIWPAAEIERRIGKDAAARFAKRYGVEPGGNVENDPQREFTGRNILYQASPVTDVGEYFGQTESQAQDTLAKAASTLFAARSQRPRPHLDNKILTSWNALMISALAAGYRVLGDASYLDAAEAAAKFVVTNMYDRSSGRLLRRYCGGDAAIDGFLDDYAFFAQALLDLFEATFDRSYFELAAELAGNGLRQFEDAEAGGFFSTSANAPDLLLRLKDDYDGAEPSGNSIAVDVLLRLSELTGDESYSARASRALQAAAPRLKSQPAAAPQLTVAFGRSLEPPAHTLIRCAAIDSEVRALLAAEWEKFDPYRVTLAIPDRDVSFYAQWPSVRENLQRKGRITIYRCRNFTCALPEMIGAHASA